MKYLGINLTDHLWTSMLKIIKPFKKNQRRLKWRNILYLWAQHSKNVKSLQIDL